MTPNQITLPAATTYLSTDLVFDRISEQNGATQYYGYASDDVTWKAHYTLTIKHTRPANPAKETSTVIRLDTDVYDLEGNPTRNDSTWLVVKNSMRNKDVFANLFPLFGAMFTANPTLVTAMSNGEY